MMDTQQAALTMVRDGVTVERNVGCRSGRFRWDGTGFKLQFCKDGTSDPVDQLPESNVWQIVEPFPEPEPECSQEYEIWPVERANGGWLSVHRPGGGMLQLHEASSRTRWAGLYRYHMPDGSIRWHNRDRYVLLPCTHGFPNQPTLSVEEVERGEFSVILPDAVLMKKRET